MLDLPDVRKLRVLREVHARGTIAAAAEALGMTPSAASQQLAALERAAGGVDLVVRTGRSVRLTPTALRLVEHTERVLEHLEAARVDLSTSPDEISGELHVAAFASAIRSVVAPALPVLRERHPALDIAIIERNTEQALPALATGTVDLALIYDYDLLPSTAPVGAHLELLMAEPMRLVLPERLAGDGGAMDLAELEHERWIAPLDGTSCNTFVRRACNQAGYEPEFWALSEDFSAIIDLVAAGVGVAMVPSIGCVRIPTGVVLRDAQGPQVHRRVHVATRAGSQGHPAVRAVVEELRRAAQVAQLELAAS